MWERALEPGLEIEMLTNSKSPRRLFVLISFWVRSAIEIPTTVDYTYIFKDGLEQQDNGLVDYHKYQEICYPNIACVLVIIRVLVAVIGLAASVS